jgi:hypothetical protein
MGDYMKEMYSYTSNLVDRAKSIYGLNLKLLLTWGASVGGFVLPLDNFIKTGRFDLNEAEQTLILVGIACSVFYDNSRALKLIYKKIKEQGLEDVFKEVLIKSKNLKNASMNGGDINMMSKTIAKRLIASGVVIVSQSVLSDAIKKLIKKLSQ